MHVSPKIVTGPSFTLSGRWLLPGAFSEFPLVETLTRLPDWALINEFICHPCRTFVATPSLSRNGLPGPKRVTRQIVEMFSLCGVLVTSPLLR